MTHYGYKENKDETKGQSQVPMLQYKDFPDLDRYCAMAKARYIAPTEELPADMVLSTTRKGRAT